MNPRSAFASEGAPAVVAATADAFGERDATPPPPTAGGPARISTVAEVITVPALWLDRLLALPQEVSFEEGEEGCATALAQAIERIVPGVRVGIRLPLRSSPFGSTPPPRKLPWSEPPKSDERVKSRRLFPDLAYERSVTLPGAAPGGALHFGADSDVFSGDGSPHLQVMDRAAGVVAMLLERRKADDRAASLDAELQLAKAQMVQAEKLASLGQIAAGMVHELNNPLTAIAAYTDFLLRKTIARDGSDADDVERLRRIAESANRMLRFTRDLVSYARPSGDVPIAVQLNGVIERALAFCEHEMSGADVTVEKELEQDLGYVRGLPEQLAQVFVNLVTNACHAMSRSPDDAETGAGGGGHEGAPHGRKPVLRITTARVIHDGSEPASTQDEVMIVVEDAGCGIRRENLELVFNPFFTTKGAGRGTGLGLSIVKNIVDGHRGKIRAESDPSYGTRFILVFPVERASLEPGAPPSR